MKIKIDPRYYTFAYTFYGSSYGYMVHLLSFSTLLASWYSPRNKIIFYPDCILLCCTLAHYACYNLTRCLKVQKDLTRNNETN